MKTKTHRVNTTRPFERVSLKVKAGLSNIAKQAVLETLVDMVVGRLNAVQANARVEYQNGRARVFGCNGQKIIAQLI